MKRWAVISLMLASAAQAQEQSQAFDTIAVTGNHRHSDQDIRATAGLTPGQALTREDLLDAVAALEYTGEFNDIRMYPRGSELVIDVDEQASYRGALSFGAGYESGTGLTGTMDLHLDDLANGMVSVDGGLSLSKKARTAGLSVAHAGLWGPGITTGLRLDYADLRYDYMVYQTKTFSAEPYLSFDLGPKTGAEIRYRFESERVANVDPAASAILQADAGRRDSHWLGASLWRSGEMGRFAWSAQLDQDVSGLMGGPTLSRSMGRVSGNLALGRGFALRSTVEAGAVLGLRGSQTRGTDRFTLGGAQMRGFAVGGISPRDTTPTGQSALGGNFFAVARTDLVVPLVPQVEQLETFAYADLGHAWAIRNSTAPSGTLDAGTALRASAGLGLATQTPLGKLEATVSLWNKAAPGDRTQRFGLAFRTDF